MFLANLDSPDFEININVSVNLYHYIPAIENCFNIRNIIER